MSFSEFYDENIERYHEERYRDFLQHVIDETESYLSSTNDPTVKGLCEVMDEECGFLHASQWMSRQYELHLTSKEV